AALGDAVEMGQRLVVLEAMKMEHVHVAATAGTIAALHVQVGAQVAQGALLVEIIPSDSK
ncbi:MAG: acetyl-CoA carboxylase biotin carboxyl carrier protein subunit, partial [Limnohabitans sp.]|nr:acetyl-CoA carboxylase biotin carboxyl carrier protein subunit [Limnohabitans sp.]